MTYNELNTTANYENYLCSCGEFYTDEDHDCYYTTEADTPTPEDHTPQYNWTQADVDEGNALLEGM